MPTPKSVPLIFLGVGNIGGTLLRQLVERSDVVAQRTGLRLMPIALADVSGSLIEPEGLAESTLHAALEATEADELLESVPGVRPLGAIEETLLPGAILADMTATPKTKPTLEKALAAGCGVVLANKIPLSGAWRQAEPLLTHPNLRYECTVGAGLPVIDTLDDLLDTGDTVTRIQGTLSGTLGYLCSQIEGGIPYAEAVTRAKSLGYTEPDPRQDLSGKDVARKALILARTAGWALEPDDLTVDALFPESMAGGSTEDFMAALEELNETFNTQFLQAASEGRTLRYVAQVGPEGGRVGLMAVDKRDPLGALRGPANRIALHTERYNEVPLAISGPGAGPEVTAAGVMNDILKLAARGLS